MYTQFKSSMVRAILGLGNPGEKYKDTYHNAGALFVKTLLKRCASSKLKQASASFFYLREKNSSQRVFAVSNVFMNESGRAARDLLNFFSIESSELLLAHDDADIALGSYRLSFDRGSAGHKGVQSLIKTLGTKDFWRLRIGIKPIGPISPIGPIGPIRTIGPIGSKRKRAGSFVLKKIKPLERRILEQVFEQIIRELQL